MLEIGLKGYSETTVSKENTALARKSGTLSVFATPAMVELIEEAAFKSVADKLDEGCASVGTALNIKHLSATPAGMKVSCRTQLVEIDGRRLVFAAEVEDEAGKIGEGMHERFIIQSEKFQQKAEDKKKG